MKALAENYAAFIAQRTRIHDLVGVGGEEAKQQVFAVHWLGFGAAVRSLAPDAREEDGDRRGFNIQPGLVQVVRQMVGAQGVCNLYSEAL